MLHGRLHQKFELQFRPRQRYGVHGGDMEAFHDVEGVDILGMVGVGRDLCILRMPYI